MFIALIVILSLQDLNQSNSFWVALGAKQMLDALG